MSASRSVVRQLIRKPAFTVVAILLLALGAGANAAVYAVVRSVLLKPLPYASPERLVAIWPDRFISNEELSYWRDHLHSLEGLAALAPGWMMGLVADGGEPLKVTGARTTDNLFTTLGVSAAIGRTIEPGDGLSGRHRVAVLSHRLWRVGFGCDPDIIGHLVQLDQEPYTIIGVMAPGFEVFAGGTDLWVPLEWTPGQGPWGSSSSLALARLAPGVSVMQASRELQALAPAMRRDLGRPDDWGRTIDVRDLRQAVTGDVRPALLILMGAVGLTLLLAAANLGALVLGRSIERMREMAVRTALGASGAQLMWQVLLEQLTVSGLGAALGLALAWTLLPLLVARIPPEVPRAGQISMDLVVFVTVLAATVGLSVAAAAGPALMSGRPALQPLLRQSRTTETPGRRRALGGLVTIQVALAVVLGIGAMLMLRSLWNLQHQNPGFEAEHVLTFRLQTTSRYRTLAAGLPYLQQVVDRLSVLPGVTSVGATAHLPLSTYAWTIPVRPADQPLPPGGQAPVVGWRFIGWDYFRTMGMALQHGRAFDSRDSTAGRPVAIVNETLARQFFGVSEDAVGRTVVQYGGGRPGEHTVTIVGVVGDVRHLGLGQAPVPEFYRPLAQTFMFPMAMIVRTTGPPAQLARSVHQAALAVDPVVAVAELQPYSTLIAGSLARPRLLSLLLTVFASAGLALVVVGLYGVVAYRVRQRELEFGVRLALGASPAGIRRGVLGQGLRHAAAGLLIGVPAALALSTALASELYGVEPRDSETVAVLLLTVLLVTLAACYVPARRASRVDPIVTLRGE